MNYVRDVAEAIITCSTAGLSRIDIVTQMGNVNMLFRDYDKSILDSLTVINKFSSKTVGGGQDLLVALVNGYTVKQELTLDERLKEGVLEIIGEDFFAETEVLADKVTKFVQSLYAEQNA
ncbi:hypothetical protein [Paenibacillus elgii]|uniref:hypothetical protein n=1 Tax=Paenibacillus elgii TaxID=189691 RepID=UPI000248C951|nr:hypothetical protein [Paenibacillus elgii]